MGFPKGFAWGTATASYQIDGATAQDGRGPCVWDMLCRKPGAVFEGHNGDVACDHYNRYAEDVALMKELGHNAYRFSVSWSRVMPEGKGKVNEKGLEFYDRLIDALLAAGVEPWLTLFHWDLPLALYHEGGWLNPASPDWFADYAQVVVDRLGDRVGHWMTLNEPQVYLGHGHHTGEHAPGDKLRWAEVLRAGHHSLIAHGKGVQVIRARAKRPSIVGFAPVVGPSIPVTNDPKDIEAARKATFSVNGQTTFSHTWWMDPVFFGNYPADGLELYKEELPPIGPDDMKTICQPIDFFGANTYMGQYVKAGPDGSAEQVEPLWGQARTGFDWPITPEALYWGPKFMYERYGKPVAITENGMSCIDWVSLDGKVHDPQRIDFLARYIGEFKRAATDGVETCGYFQWSFMDNFEWAEGYKQRFGLVYVDFQTQKRTPKDSAYWYRDVIASNGENL